MDTINLLWTGGWDSTYRLLHLVLNHEAVVQPYYIHDSRRKSTEIEHRVRDEIIQAMTPRLRGTLLPTQVVAREQISEDSQGTDRLSQLAGQTFLGDQYQWLAHFAIEYDLQPLELSITRESQPHDFLADEVERIDDGYGPNYQLRQPPSADMYQLFAPFRMPLLETTKRQMKTYAEQSGIVDILEMSWFCYNPGPDHKPCGRCNPCASVMRKGMGYRLPLRSRMRYHTRWPRNKAKGLKRRLGKLNRR